MSKKHFRMLAKEFHEAMPEKDQPEQAWQWNIDIELVADVCAQVNPNFNREKFLTACREGL